MDREEQGSHPFEFIFFFHFFIFPLFFSFSCLRRVLIYFKFHQNRGNSAVLVPPHGNESLQIEGVLSKVIDGVRGKSL